MKIIYRHYEPDQELEEIQAKIYSEVSGLPASSRHTHEGDMSKDPKFTRYALTEDGKPLAYVTARGSRSHVGRIYIGYPWALPDCPAEAQEKIFDELLTYIKKYKKPLEIASGAILSSRIAEEEIKFLRGKGFVEKERVYYYNLDFDVYKVSKWEITDEVKSYNSRLATTDDLDLLVELGQADPNMRVAFPNQEACRNYFRDRVLQDGHVVLVFHGDEVVAAGTAIRVKPDGFYLIGDEKRVLIRFVAIRQGCPQAWKLLLIGLAKECLAAGWGDTPLRVRFHFFASSQTAIYLAKMRPELEAFEVILAYQGNREELE